MLLAFVDTDPLTARDARMVWDVIRQHQAWGDRYADRMRRETVKSLRRSGRKDVAAALVGRMRPVVRSPEVCSGHVVAPRSGMDKMFNVQDCLPIRAARHPCIERCARILVRCTDRVGTKKTITTMLSLYNRLFMRLAPDDDDWSTLQSIPLTKWLEAYDADLRDTRSVSYQHLCVSLRYIGRLYNKIMIENGSDRWHMRTEVPIPLLHEHPMFLGDDNDKNSSLRRQVMRMRVQRCVDNGVPPHEDMTMSACSPRQVRSLIVAAASTHERLVLMILLTTGLRTGGVASPRTVDGVDLQTASEMPRKMVASEKYGVERVVALSDCVRGLVARWVQETRYKREDTPPNPYLFPGGLGGNVDKHKLQMTPTHTTSASVCRIMRVLFRRVGLTAHPHCMRHTLVKLLFLGGGLSFEKIARFIGHTDCSLTATTYCRLAKSDLVSMVSGVPFLEYGSMGQLAQQNTNEWRELIYHIADPFPFTQEERNRLNKH